MNPSQIHAFFIQIGVMLAVAWLFGYVMKKIAQPTVLGELIGGVLLGPTLLGAAYPDIYTQLFLIDNTITASVEALIKLGMLFFMFSAGLEINISHLRQHKTIIASTSLLGGMIPFLLGFFAVMLYPELWGQHNHPLLLALFIGTALSISALPVIARILMDLNMIRSRIGMTIMTSAMINDILGWLLFAFILQKMGNENQDTDSLFALLKIIAYITVVLGAGRWLIQPFLHRNQFFNNWPGGLLGFVSVLVILAAAAAESIGIHAIFGAFLVGIALSQRQNERQHQIHEKDNYSTIQTFALNFFAPLYFVSIGLKANFATQFDSNLVMIIIFIACLGKIVGAGLGAKLGGMRWKEALSVGIGLNARGAIEIVMASVALEYQLIDQRIFVALVLMAFATSIFSALLLMQLVK